MVIMSPLKKRRVAHSAQFCLTDTVFVCWFYWAPYVTIMEESLYTVSYFDSYFGFGPTLDQTSGAPISKVHSRASTVGSTLKGPCPGSTPRATLLRGYGKPLSLCIGWSYLNFFLSKLSSLLCLICLSLLTITKRCLFKAKYDALINIHFF